MPHPIRRHPSGLPGLPNARGSAIAIPLKPVTQCSGMAIRDEPNAYAAGTCQERTARLCAKPGKALLASSHKIERKDSSKTCGTRSVQYEGLVNSPQALSCTQHPAWQRRRTSDRRVLK